MRCAVGEGELGHCSSAHSGSSQTLRGCVAYSYIYCKYTAVKISIADNIYTIYGFNIT